MTKQISISEDDIKEMEEHLSTKRGGMTNDEENFLEYLLKRAKAGKQSAPATDIRWTWTYNF